MKKSAFSILISLLLGSLFCGAVDGTLRTRVETVLADIVKELSAGVTKTADLLPRLKSLAEADPTNDAVFYYLAVCQQRSGMVSEAAGSFGKAISLDGGNLKYKEALASLYLASGNGAQATSIFLELLEKDPKHYRNAFTLTALGDNYLTSQKDSLALDSYDAALMYDPGYAPAILGKSEVFRMRGNFPAFFVTIGEFAADRDIVPAAKCDYIERVLQRVDGKFYYAWHGQLDSLVSTTLAAHPEDSSALKLAGKWFYGTGQKGKGIQCFGKILTLYPNDLDARYFKIQILSEGGDRKELIRECEAFLKLYPDYVPVLNDYAYFLSLEKKQLGKAEKMSLKALEADSDNPAYLDTYGWILHLKGKDAKAKPFFKRAIVYGGKGHKEILLHYSAVLEALGEKDLANYYKTLGEAKKQ